MKALILAGGKAEDFGVLARFTPKLGIRILGKPIIGYSLEPLLKLVSKVVVVVSSEDGLLTERIRELRDVERVQIVRQSGEGISAAVLSAREHFTDDDTVLLAYGDIIAAKELFAEALNTYMSASEPLVMTVTAVSKGFETYGTVYLDTSNERVTRIVEKPSEGPGTSFVAAGVFVARWSLFKRMASSGDVIAFLNRLAKAGQVKAHVWVNSWVDIKYPWDLLEAVRVLLEERSLHATISPRAKISPTAVIEGPVIVEDGAVIDHYAVIKGPVYIGEGAFVGAHTLVREFSSIERKSVVGARSELKRSVLLEGAFVSSNVYLADSVVGERATVGPNTVTLSVFKGELPPRLRSIVDRVVRVRKLGSIIGSGATVAAGTIVRAGSVIK